MRYSLRITIIKKPHKPIENSNYQEINFLTLKFPVGNLQKTSQNHKKRYKVKKLLHKVARKF